ncbi:ABC transporter substrate-binding protein [Kiloniella sp.]|uniref:ABC transporter substrate-binding protein n=1 Tax=Kiloniella sp. TaxID=1938587 RepID=UPI003B02B01F
MALLRKLFSSPPLKTIGLCVCLILAQIPMGSFTSSISAEPIDILMVLWRGETDAERGFRDKLKQTGTDARITIYNAGQDRQALATALRTGELKIHNFDYIYTFGTTVSHVVKTNIKNKVPQIFCVAFDPVKSKLVNSLNGSGDNITGVSSRIPIRKSVEMATSIFQIKHLAVLFNPREQNSFIQVDELISLGKQIGIQVTPIRVVPKDAFLDQVLNQLSINARHFDTVLIPGDSYLKSQAAKAMAVLRKTNLKIIANNVDYIREGALIGLVADFYTIGQNCGDMLLSVQAGENIAQMPIGSILLPDIMMNQDTIHRLNVEIPAEIIQTIHFITSETDGSS